MSTETGTGVKRRDFLKILGATGATTAVVGCSSEKVGKLIPYVTSPDNTVAGVSQYYATTCRECASACGVMAEVRDGRPIKLEGNPEHPLNRGAICATGLSAMQGLYNPDRFRSPMVREGGALKPTTWAKAYELLAQKIGEVKSKGVAGNVVFINQHETGTFPGFLDQWLAAQGMPPHLSVDPMAPMATIASNQKAYGAAWPALDFSAAKLVVSFGADFLDGWGHSVPQQLDWADARAQARRCAAARRTSARVARSPASMPISGSRPSPEARWRSVPRSNGGSAATASDASRGSGGDDRSAGRRRSRAPAAASWRFAASRPSTRWNAARWSLTSTRRREASASPSSRRTATRDTTACRRTPARFRREEDERGGGAARVRRGTPTRVTPSPRLRAPSATRSPRWASRCRSAACPTRRVISPISCCRINHWLESWGDAVSHGRADQPAAADARSGLRHEGDERCADRGRQEGSGARGEVQRCRLPQLVRQQVPRRSGGVRDRAHASPTVAGCSAGGAATPRPDVGHYAEAGRHDGRLLRGRLSVADARYADAAPTSRGCRSCPIPSPSSRGSRGWKCTRRRSRSWDSRKASTSRSKLHGGKIRRRPIATWACGPTRSRSRLARDTRAYGRFAKNRRRERVRSRAVGGRDAAGGLATVGGIEGHGDRQTTPRGWSPTERLSAPAWARHRPGDRARRLVGGGGEEPAAHDSRAIHRRLSCLASAAGRRRCAG